jgi:hypothetical protein
VIVGLAAATICLWIFFFIRKRRRRRRIDHDSAISASLAAAGYNRAPIDDDGMFDPAPGMRQRFSSFSSHPTISTPITDEERVTELTGGVNLFDPYAEVGHPMTGTGYIPARSDSPSQSGRDRMTDSGTYTSGVSGRMGSRHIPQHSTGSSDKLLSGIAPPPEGLVQPYPLTAPTIPPRNPKRQDGQSPDNAGGSGVHAAYDPPPPVYRTAGAQDQKPRGKG